MARNGYTRAFLLLQLLITVIPNASAQTADGAVQFVRHNLPAQLDIGQAYAVELEIKNVGTGNWTRNGNVVLAIQGAGNAQSWGVTRVELAPSEVIAPGDAKTFRFDIRAPATPGTYELGWNVLAEGTALGGGTAAATTIMVEDPFLTARFVSQLLPNRVEPGETFRAIVQFRNAGKTSWAAEQGYRLSAATAAVATTWHVDRVDLEAGTHVLPEQTATFAFSATAPKVPGRYGFAWQMFRDGRGFFGQPSPEISIQVGQAATRGAGDYNAEVVSEMVPDTATTGGTYEVTLVFKNTGTQGWRSDRVSLQSQNPPENLQWFLSRIDLAPGEVVKAGAIKAFHFKIRAPSEPGDYNFQWQLVDETLGRFGDASELRPIHVQAPR
jgi:hypothetical protein